jgi:preprotein translocase subunit Sss1
MFLILRIIAVVFIAIPLLLANKDSKNEEYTKKKKIIYSVIAFIGIILFIISMFYR